MVTIRAATAKDARAIAGIHVETWRATYAGLVPDRVLVKMSRGQHAAKWSSMIRQRGAADTVMVAEGAGAEVVGFGSCGPARGTGLPFAGEVYTLYVLHDHQGEGIGKRLLGALFQRLLDQGMESALIWVLAQNPARFFYEATGGKRVAEREQKLWGATLVEAAYGWPNLARSVAGLHGR